MNEARDFVLEIYDTVADQSRWPGVLEKFSDKVGARGCIIFEWADDGAERRLFAPHMSALYEQEKLEAYLSAFHAQEAEDQDRFEELSLATDAIDLIDDAMLFTDEAAWLARPNIKAMIEFGLRHRAAGLLDKDNTKRSRFSMQFGATHGPMNDDERALVAGLLPHVAKALDLGRPAAQLAATHRHLIAAMDRLRIGVCILDGKGSVVVANQEFDRQREAYRAFRVTSSGQLRLHDPADERRFMALRSDAMNHGRFGARPRKEAIPVVQDDSIGALCIEVAPLHQVDEIGAAALRGTIVYSVDTSLPVGCDASPLRQVFGLTEAEAALAELLATGITNAEIAEVRARSVATVNAQVKSLLSKTDCANRTQFVRLLMNFGADYLSAETAA